MRRDGLASVLRLRRLAQAEARRLLAERLAAEARAEAAVADAEAAIEREREAALDLAAGDATVEAFGAWLPVGRKAQAGAAAGHETALAETARARAELGAARAAVEAAERVAAAREAARAGRLRKKQELAAAELAQRQRADKDD